MIPFDKPPMTSYWRSTVWDGAIWCWWDIA